MATKPETLIVNAIIRTCRKAGANGCWIEKLHGHNAQRRGIVDLLVCHRGVFFVVEVKTPTGTIRKDQLLVIEELEAAGATVPVVTSVLEFKHILEEIDQHGCDWGSFYHVYL